jgi:hypothetical protein
MICDDLISLFFIISLSVLHGIPAYRWEIGGINDLYTHISLYMMFFLRKTFYRRQPTHPVFQISTQ